MVAGCPHDMAGLKACATQCGRLHYLSAQSATRRFIQRSLDGGTICFIRM
jgi:hypothetical protein